MQPLTPLRLTYLALAILGTIVPMFYFVSWFNEFGWSLAGMVEAWNVNNATTGLVYDLTIAAVALTIWIIAESIARKDWWGLAAVPTIYCIGVSCGLPLYLFLRSRKLD
ncbi:MAG: DUF2834 domain-containing protein [Rubricella sp.]